MSRRTQMAIVAVAALMVMAAVGLYSWPRPPGAVAPPDTDVIRVVRRGPAPAVDRSPPGNDTPATSPATSEPAPDVAAMDNGIPEDAAIEKSLPDPANDPRALYRRIRSEPRDAAWAARSESGIAPALAGIPNLKRGEALRIRCASTLCEVSGRVPKGVATDGVAVVMDGL